MAFDVALSLVELPPRTRRILPKVYQLVTKKGTTSAHAENTRLCVSTFGRTRNYLRARGEYTTIRINIDY